jgi:tetratricopeptide (TPR) repeat protein
VQLLAANVLRSLEDPKFVLHCERALSLAPDSLKVRFSLALCHLDFGRYGPARRLAEEILERDPSDFGAHWVLGIIHHLRAERDLAIEHLTTAISLKPRHFNGANVWLGGLYGAFGEFEKAERTYRNALQSFPGDLSSRWMLAVVLQAQGKHDEALREYCEALPRFANPDFFVGQWALSDMLRWRPLASDLRPLDGFVETYGQRFAGIDIPAGTLQAWGLALLRAPAKRDAGKALTLLEQAAEKSKGEDPRILASLADARFEAGMRGEAVRTLERALRLPGACGRHREQLEDFRARMLPAIGTLATVDVLVGTSDINPAKVRMLLEGCRRSDEDGPESEVDAYIEGLTLEADGRLEEAAAAFAHLAAAAPWATEPALREAQCLRRLGRLAEAEAVLRQAIAADPEETWPLWEVWWRVAVGDLRMPPSDVLAALPGVSPASPERAGFRWVLERQAVGEPLRIDCGATADLTGPNGRAWSRDRFARGGSVPEGGKTTVNFFWPHDGPIAGTHEEAVYRTERWFLPEELCRGYRIPVLVGSYRVTLHFAEVWWRARSAGAFDVRLEGREVLGDFQPLDAGFATAQAPTFEVEVGDGFLDLELVWDGPDLPWYLAPPKISGIEVEPIR